MYILEEINTKSFKEYVESDQDILYIKSEWGTLPAGDAFFRHITNKKTPTPKIYVDYVFSVAFNLIYNLNDVGIDVEILEWAHAMVHIVAWNVMLGPNLQPRWEYEKFKFQEQLNSADHPYIEEILTEEEYEIYKKWGEVFFWEDRIKSILSK